MKELILLKLGGSLITDKTKPYTARHDVIRRIANEIHEARKEKDFLLIVGHGGGSFPHQSATKYQTQKGIINEKSIEGIAKVQNDAAALNHLVVSALIDAGENAVSIQPSAGVTAENSRIKKWDLSALKSFLELKMVPVPYGDVVLDEKQGCCIISTEEILTYIAGKLGGKRIILAGKVDGVLDGESRVIKQITPKNFNEIKKYLKGSDGADATGGMLHKVERMLEFTKKGILSEIINGEKPGYVKRALLGETGTGTTIKA